MVIKFKFSLDAKPASGCLTNPALKPVLFVNPFCEIRDHQWNGTPLIRRESNFFFFAALF